MSKQNGRFSKSRYNEDGLREGRQVSHQERLNEKRLRSALHSKCFDIVDDEEDDDNPHWLFQDETSDIEPESKYYED